MLMELEEDGGDETANSASAKMKNKNKKESLRE